MHIQEPDWYLLVCACAGIRRGTLVLVPGWTAAACTAACATAAFATDNAYCLAIATATFPITTATLPITTTTFPIATTALPITTSTLPITSANRNVLFHLDSSYA